MKNIFISYTTSDRQVAYALTNYLEAKGVSCFIAPRDVDPGKAYAANLMKAIDECSVVLLIASNAINESEHVLNEVDVIVEKKKPLLPVFIEDFTLNDDYRYYLGRKQWVVAYPDSVDRYFPKIFSAAQGFLPKRTEPLPQTGWAGGAGDAGAYGAFPANGAGAAYDMGAAPNPGMAYGTDRGAAAVPPAQATRARAQMAQQQQQPGAQPVPQPAQPAPAAESDRLQPVTSTVFEYNPERGIMTNPEDHQRNVSFRTDTLINLLGGIYENVGELVSPEAAEQIFFTSGHTSGRSFAEHLNSQWDTGYSFAEIKDKLDKWCTFDSAVGWGRFSVDLGYDEATEQLSGTLSINESFLVDKGKKRKICEFVRGYCTGVLEVLLDSDSVKLTCKDCPLHSRFHSVCVFDIDIQEQP